ncbi:uncharacterized protein LOC134277325, partial [Saccostrea cucullata]|uniref:uncharacterized protein LOC134277325 n=1 Tax=Saccostrea cuccullata TaxID=36930 RepID=UPI002ED306FE
NEHCGVQTDKWKSPTSESESRYNRIQPMGTCVIYEFPNQPDHPSRQTLQPITQPQGMGNANAAPQQQTSSSISGGLSAAGLAGLLVAIIFISGLFAFGVIFLKRRQYPAGSGGQGTPCTTPQRAL